jgi:HEAT repeat protein
VYISPTLLYALMACITAVLVFLAVLTSLWSLLRIQRERREARLLAELRPRLLEVIELDEGASMAVSRRERPVLIALAHGLLPSLRGAERTRLEELLEELGVVNQALLELHARSATRRMRAAELVGRAGVARALPELMRLLHDRDADVRRSAARALGLIGDTNAAYALMETIDARSVSLNTSTMALMRMGREVNAPLAHGLAFGTVTLRATCAELLGLRLAISALDVLTTAARTDPALEVRIRAIRALGNVGAPTSVDVLAEAMAADQPAPVRAVATRALGRIGGPRTLSLLRRALDAPEHMIASNAARELAHSGPEGEELLIAAASQTATRTAEYAQEGLSFIELARAGRR